MVGIVPKNISKSDFCGVDDYYYMVRTDINCYMKSKNFNTAEDLHIYTLHRSCRDGEHYLAYEDGHFYIIKEGQFRKVTNMHEDSGSVVYTLHPNCKGGDHYFSAFSCFYIIFLKKGVYRRVTSLNTDGEAKEFTLHPDCKDGLYYWGIKNSIYFVKPVDKWGIQYVRCTNLNSNDNAKTFSFHESVVSFMPGGVIVTKGPSFGQWVCIKHVINDSPNEIEWQQKVTKRVGYEKEKMSSLEHNWNVSTTVSAEAGGLTSLIAQATFSLTAEYGGCSVNTESENWSEATEVEETITMKLKQNECFYIFVYVLGLGKDTILHCQNMRILGTSTPPTDVPLPPSIK